MTCASCVNRIERFLRSNYTYTEAPPRRRYPLVAFLLEDREGYCQQFSGAMALLLGIAGIYGVISYSVSQRTREIGVEKALGARRWHILLQFLAEALAITALGGIAGVFIAYLVSWAVGPLRRAGPRRAAPA